MIYHSIALVEGYLLIRDFCFSDGSSLMWTRSSFPCFEDLKISTRVFSLPIGQLVLCLVWPDSPDSGLSNDGRAKFVALVLKGR
jgi:hypothetical protein